MYQTIKDTEHRNTTWKPKQKNMLKTAVSAALALCLFSSLGLNIYQAKLSAVQNKKVNKFIEGQLERQAKEEEKANTYLEDGYIIGNEYEIRSTKSISDAYINGDVSTLNDEDKQTLKMASDILQKITKESMNDYEKELAVYEWMYQNIRQGSGTVVQSPGSTNNAYTPYRVLSGSNAVCVGYATTFRLFMNMLGIDCHIVHNEYHSWDMVQLEDNEWYQVDIYTDVSANCKYQNFNITDEVCRNSHDWDDSSLPEAKGIKYSYAVQNSCEVKDIYTVPAKLKEIMDKKKSSVFYKFNNQLTREQFPIADILLGQLNTALMSLPGFENYNITGMWFPDEDETYILGIFINNYNETNRSAFDENSLESKKITEAVSKAFGVELFTSDTGEDIPKETTSSKTVDSSGKTVH